MTNLEFYVLFLQRSKELFEQQFFKYHNVHYSIEDKYYQLSLSGFTSASLFNEEKQVLMIEQIFHDLEKCLLHNDGHFTMKPHWNSSFE